MLESLNSSFCERNAMYSPNQKEIDKYSVDFALELTGTNEVHEL